MKGYTMAAKTKKYSLVRNEALHEAMVEIRRSSATQRHTLKARKGSRAAKKRNALRDYV